MKTIKFIVVVSIVVLATSLVYHQVNGQTTEHEKIEIFLASLPDIKIKYLIAYCKDQLPVSENPIADLVKDGTLSSKYNNVTCSDVAIESFLRAAGK